MITGDLQGCCHAGVMSRCCGVVWRHRWVGFQKVGDFRHFGVDIHYKFAKVTKIHQMLHKKYNTVLFVVCVACG